eukprot:scaffold75375_cov65-Phaeocystis_antarctica.AAC.6
MHRCSESHSVLRSELESALSTSTPRRTLSRSPSSARSLAPTADSPPASASAFARRTPAGECDKTSSSGAVWVP